MRRNTKGISSGQTPEEDLTLDEIRARKEPTGSEAKAYISAIHSVPYSIHKAIHSDPYSIHTTKHSDPYSINRAIHSEPYSINRAIHLDPYSIHTVIYWPYNSCACLENTSGR